MSIEISTLEKLDEYLSEQNNLENSTYISKIPQICKDEPCVLGIDEAGRGPVLGPMVYGIAFCPKKKTNIFETLKCADSKVLNEENRNDIFTELCKSNDTVGWAVEVISPNNICHNMYSRSKISLNQISMDSAIGLVRKAISEGVNIAEIYVDTVGPPEKYQKYLLSLFPAFSITVAKKADSTYPVVSAASICAKVTRDHALQVWNFQEGLKLTQKQFGSGYPAGIVIPISWNENHHIASLFNVLDPVTKKFLVDNMDPVFGFPKLVRFSWSTSENALEKAAYNVEWEELKDEEESSPTKNTSITNFFKVYQKNKKQKKIKHAFFTERRLNTVTEF